MSPAPAPSRPRPRTRPAAVVGVGALVAGLVGAVAPTAPALAATAGAQERPAAAACLPGRVLQTPTVPPVGTSRQLVLYVDFPDAPVADRAVSAEEREPLDRTTPFWSEVSHGRVDVALDHHPTWLRAPFPSDFYELADQGRPFVQRIVNAVDPQVDFSGYEAVHVVPSPGTRSTISAAFVVGTTVTSAEAVLRAASYERFGLEISGRRLVAHETGHLLGQKDLYPYDPRLANPYVGGWDVMGVDSGHAPGVVGVHRRASGWTDPSDVACVTDAATTTVDLEPLAADDGRRLAVVPTGPTTYLGVEHRTAAGVDEGICRTGVLVYEVDEQVPGGAGPVRVVDPTPEEFRDGCRFPVDDAALQAGDSLAVAGTGVTVRVVSADDGGAQVVVERASAAPVRLPRLAGPDRLATAAAVSRQAFDADSADAVVLARSDGFADALAGTPLAVASDGPVLLTRTDGLDRVVSSEVDRVLPDGGRVYLLGGSAAVGPQVEDDLVAAGYDVRRLAGADRFATAVEVAEELGGPGDVLLASGTDFPDALAAGAAAAQVGAAVLLTDDDRRAAPTDGYLAARPDGRRWAVGGPAAAAHPTARPVVGVDRYDTAARVAEMFVPEAEVLAVTRGDAFPDALAGGAVVGARAGAVLLTAADAPPPAATQEYLCDRGDDVSAALLLGGGAALSERAADLLADALRGGSCG